MQSYSVQDIERVLRLSRSTIRGLVEVGFVKPTRGARRAYQFSFQDLIVLRAARALIDAKVPRRRIHRALQDLRKHLPQEAPLSGLSIAAIGDQVVVREGRNQFQVTDGQYVLGLDIEVDQGVLRVVEHKRAVEPQAAPAEDCFARALDLESTDPRAALEAYEQAVGHDAEHVAAWTNWGRLLHEQGRLKESEQVYRRGKEQCGADAVLMFNLGVVLEDLGRTDDALGAYNTAITEDPTLADCHYNLARLYESLGKEQHALRHFGQYRRLIAAGRS